MAQKCSNKKVTRKHFERSCGMAFNLVENIAVGGKQTSGWIPLLLTNCVILGKYFNHCELWYTHSWNVNITNYFRVYDIKIALYEPRTHLILSKNSIKYSSNINIMMTMVMMMIVISDSLGWQGHYFIHREVGKGFNLSQDTYISH